MSENRFLDFSQNGAGLLDGCPYRQADFKGELALVHFRQQLGVELASKVPSDPAAQGDGDQDSHRWPDLDADARLQGQARQGRRRRRHC